ncbi:hypothetical protein [Ciceribacter ferrooxidans]|uniref:Uncharacterized protein n=1 Tax=Ciceribacter ferrooxidans TaxID=2509717 RepID=A0A4V1RPP4_9HYPH|nr:hypothetical protein [Ciceribacter ferrooxidans]RYC10067.1 hypothetical protein EUU22_18510 [Ciceribacter ferrooxidans]
MTKNLNWKVLRMHEGDRIYHEGEVRQGSMEELGHLSPLTLQLIEPEARKAEGAPLNKAEGAAPANKARTGRKAK